MEFPFVLIPIFLTIVGLSASLYALRRWGVESPDSESPQPTSTRQIPDVDEDFDVPEEDQQYLAPLMVKTLKHLATNKRSYPTNAQLINHLAEALSRASGEFKRRTSKDKTIERGNDLWLDVAAIAIRLFDEGTYHNADNTREQFMTTGVLARRELGQWAKQVNEEVAAAVRKKMGVDKEEVEDATQHAQTIADSPYTADEVEDMKRSHDMKLIKRSKKK